MIKFTPKMQQRMREKRIRDGVRERLIQELIAKNPDLGKEENWTILKNLIKPQLDKAVAEALREKREANQAKSRRCRQNKTARSEKQRSAKK